MADNAFTAGQGVPARLVAGDFWTWRADGLLAAYPPASYSLAYSLAPREGGTATTASATSDADGWVVEVPAATTAPLAAGTYAWTLTATRLSDGARATICAGTVEVAPDPSAAGDTRTPARRLLDAIESVLEGRVSKDVDAYSIEGRSLTRIPFAELRATRARLLREVAAEERAAKGQSGLITYSRVRF